MRGACCCDHAANIRLTGTSLNLPLEWGRARAYATGVSGPISPTATASAAEQRFVAAIGWTVLASLSFASMWGVIKYTSQTLGYHPFMIVVARNFFGVVACVPMMVALGPELLRTHRLSAHARRATSGVIATFATFYAISNAPLATALSINYAAPLVATVGAVFFLGERIRIRRMLALAVGFIGVLIVLRPGHLPMSMGIAAAMISAAATAFSIVAIKQLTATDDYRAVIVYSFVLMLIPSILIALPYWRWPDLKDVPVLALIGLLAVTGQTGLTRSYRLVEVTVLMPFDFIRFGGVILIGWIFFQEHIDAFTILGGCIIFLSTIYLAHRERVAARIAMPARQPREL
jgi:drug/metabolite transporter (DMT)-like permease